MTGRDPLDELHALAHVGERAARPTDPARIRSLGERRGRRRRAGAAVAALTVAALAGAVGFSVAGPGVLPILPAPAGPPPVTAEPTVNPAEPLTEDDLVRPEDLPVREGQQAEEFDRNARPDHRPSTCFAESLDTLGPAELLTRSFRYVVTEPGASTDIEDPLYEQPTTYTAALRFADEAAAVVAYDRLSDWIENCADSLDREGLRAPGGGPVRGFDRWFPVRGRVATARFTEFSYQRRDMQDGNGYFESVGLVRVDDRVAIAVSLHYGQDSNWDVDPDAAEVGPHPLADLLPRAAERLAP